MHQHSELKCWRARNALLLLFYYYYCYYWRYLQKLYTAKFWFLCCKYCTKMGMVSAFLRSLFIMLSWENSDRASYSMNKWVYCYMLTRAHIWTADSDKEWRDDCRILLCIVAWHVSCSFPTDRTYVRVWCTVGRTLADRYVTWLEAATCLLPRLADWLTWWKEDELEWKMSGNIFKLLTYYCCCSDTLKQRKLKASDSSYIDWCC